MDRAEPLRFNRDLLNAGHLTLQAEVEAKLRRVRRLGKIVSHLHDRPTADPTEIRVLLQQIREMLDVNATVRELLLELQSSAEALAIPPTDHR